MLKKSKPIIILTDVRLFKVVQAVEVIPDEVLIFSQAARNIISL